MQKKTYHQEVVAAKRKAKMDFWTNVIQDQIESGLSVQEYCQKKSYSTSTFYYYQKKVREAYLETFHTDDSIADGQRKTESSPVPLPTISGSDVPASIEDASFVEFDLSSSTRPAESAPAIQNEMIMDAAASGEQAPAVEISTRDFRISIYNHANPALISRVLEVLTC